jgi:CPA1 family monovalent cation:H+ antiporter
MPLSETVLIIAGLLAVAIFSAGLFRNVPIPYTVLLVIIGMVLGESSRLSPALAPLEEFRLSSDLVFFIFLPALIFESGFNLDARQLIKELAPVLVLAVPALLISTAVVGLGLSFMGFGLVTALLFGALISATDPVAVIALFKELGAPERLTVLVEGESLLNDATAIVVFGIILAIAVGGESLSWSDTDTVVVEFLRVFVGGALVGGLLGIAVSELLYRLHSGVPAVLTMSVVVAYGSFILAEHTLHVSGVMAGAAAAVTLAGFGMTRLRHEASDAAGEMWEVIALVCNSLLFLLVGMSVEIGKLAAALGPAAVTVVLILAARAAAVYGLVPVTMRLFSLPHVSLREQHIMWWGGLKGGLAIAIVLSIPEDFPGRQLLLEMTLAVVMFTLLVNAPTIRPLMNILKLDRLTAEEHVELRHALQSAHHEADEILDQFRTAGLISERAYEQVRLTGEKTFGADAVDAEGDQRTRDRYLASLLALRREHDELNAHYETGLIPQYVFLDMRNDLHRVKGTDAKLDKALGVKAQEDESILNRLESTLIRWLREKNWAAPLLSMYQNVRLAQHLQRDMVHILICQSVLEMLRKREDLHSGARWSIAAPYEARLTYHRRNVESMGREFPEFYARFESRVSSQAALASATRHSRQMLHHGEVGAKAFKIIERRIGSALDDLAPLSHPLPAATPKELRDITSLLKDLPEQALKSLATSSQSATYLPGDTIIEQTEKGDAFYIITHGDVSVFRRSADGVETQLGELHTGDFFGETSLLFFQARSHERSATIRARTPVTLLRLPRREMLKLMEKYPDLNRHMQEVHRERTTPQRALRR